MEEKMVKVQLQILKTLTTEVALKFLLKIGWAAVMIYDIINIVQIKSQEFNQLFGFSLFWGVRVLTKRCVNKCS